MLFFVINNPNMFLIRVLIYFEILYLFGLKFYMSKIIKIMHKPIMK